jgi:hypothetical protein
MILNVERFTLTDFPRLSGRSRVRLVTKFWLPLHSPLPIQQVACAITAFQGRGAVIRVFTFDFGGRGTDLSP